MAKIYVASKDVYGVGEHSYWVFDPDDNPYNSNERIIRGGDTNTHLINSPYLMEVDREILNSRDTLYDYNNGNIVGSFDPYIDRNYTTVVSGSLQDVEATWSTMVNAAKTFGNVIVDPWIHSEGGHIEANTDAYILPESNYDLFATNCNCFTNTIGFTADIDFINHLPRDGGDYGTSNSEPLIQYTGYDNIFISKLNDVVLLTNRNSASYDQGGNDTYIYNVTDIDSLSTINIYEDTISSSNDKLVLTNVNASDIRFGYNTYGDFKIFFGGNHRSNPAISIEQQYAGGEAKINEIYIYQENGEGVLVLDISNASDFRLLPISIHEGDLATEPQSSQGWVEGVLQIEGDAEHFNQLVEGLEEEISYGTLESRITFSQKYPIQFLDQNGEVSEVFLDPAERKVVEFERLIADAETGGIVISDVERTTELYGTTFNTRDKLVELVDGSRLVTSEIFLPSDGVQASNGVRSVFLHTHTDASGQIVLKQHRITEFVDFAGNIHVTTETRTEDGQTLVQETITDTNGISAESATFVVPDAGLIDTLQFAGSTAGGLLASRLAEDDILKGIAYKAIINTITDHFGSFTGYLAAGGTVESAVQYARGVEIDNPVSGVLLDSPEISTTFLKHFVSSSGAALANVIVDEVGEALGLDGTVGGEVFNVVAGTVTTGIASAGFGLLFNQLDASQYTTLLNAGFDFGAPFYDPNLPGGGIPDGQIGPPAPNTTVGDFVQAQVINALAGYAGNRLAGELIEPESEMAAIFGSVGSALGTAIATGAIAGGTAVGSAFSSLAAAGALGGPIGIAIGAFIGTFAGTALGNIFGGADSPQAWTRIGYNRDTNEYELTASWDKDGGDTTISRQLANSVIDGVNSIIEATGASIRSTAGAPSLDIGIRRGVFEVAGQKFENASDAIAFGAFRLLKASDLVGGYAVSMRAWNNSDAQNFLEFKDDLEIAEAFQLYLSNPTGILALMLDQPDSELAQSWAAILQRAAELELHLPHEKDIDGGWNELLLARGDIDPSLIPDIQGDSIVLTDPITGEETILHHVIGPGYEIIRMEGTDGNDIIEVVVDGPSIAYVDAGAGDDTIEGSDERDIIVGGSGDDTINGNAGDDWINGGSGNDTIHGNGGLDLIYGGDDDDTLFGDESADSVYGGAGDDIIEGLSGNDKLYGGSGNDTLTGGTGVDYLYGEKGDDTLHGDGSDILRGGAGNDTFMLSSRLNNIYIGRGEGHDILYAPGYSGAYNRLVFDETIGANEIWYTKQGNDLKLTVLGENQSITIKNFEAVRDHLVVYLHNDTKVALNLSTSSYTNISAPVGEEGIVSDAALGQYELYQDNVYDQYNAFNRAHYMQAYYAGNSIIDNLGNFSFSNPQSPALFIGHGDLNAANYLEAPQQQQHVPVIYGGAKNDILAAHFTRGNSLFGDSGDDILYGSTGGFGYNQKDILVGGLGNDALRGYDDDDRLFGGAGNDDLYGGNHDDELDGGYGNDRLYGQSGNDTLIGGAGDDILNDTSTGTNTLEGGAGNDELISGAGDDILDGGEGDDILTSSGGNNRLSGGAGNDSLTVSATGSNLLLGGAGNDELISGAGDDILDGGAGDDTLISSAGNSQLLGGSGNDLLSGGAGDDVLDGGDGIDTVTYGDLISGIYLEPDDTGVSDDNDVDNNNSLLGITVDLTLSSGQVTNDGEGGVDTLSGIENIIGSSFNDTLTLSNESYSIDGGSGLDTVKLYGFYQDYILADIADGISIQDIFETDNIHTLYNVERIEFADGFYENKIFTAYATEVISIEAEDAILTDGLNPYHLKSSSAASGGQLVELQNSGDQGKIGINFSAISGYYDLEIFYFDENDGASSYKLSINGQVLNNASWLADAALGADSASAQTLTSHVIQNIKLREGDFIELHGMRDSGEPARVDKFVFSPHINPAEEQEEETMLNEIIGSDLADIIQSDSQDHDAIYGGLENDKLYGYEGNDYLYGEAGNDTLFGGIGDDILYGGIGNDIFYGQAGNDIIDGGEGVDWVRYSDESHGVTVELAENIAIGGGGYTDALLNIEFVLGSKHDDTLYGNSEANRFYGHNGNDLIYGREGNDILRGQNGDDILYGGAGRDILSGGSGADLFVLERDSAFDDVDRIKDFDVIEGDKIYLSDLLTGYDPVTDLITDFVEITDNETHSYLNIDRDGGADQFEEVARFDNTLNLKIEDILIGLGDLSIDLDTH